MSQDQFPSHPELPPLPVLPPLLSLPPLPGRADWAAPAPVSPTFAPPVPGSGVGISEATPATLSFSEVLAKKQRDEAEIKAKAAERTRDREQAASDLDAGMRADALAAANALYHGGKAPTHFITSRKYTTSDQELAWIIRQIPFERLRKATNPAVARAGELAVKTLTNGKTVTPNKDQPKPRQDGIQALVVTTQGNLRILHFTEGRVVPSDDNWVPLEESGSLVPEKAGKVDARLLEILTESDTVLEDAAKIRAKWQEDLVARTMQSEEPAK
jgi:hypothetical protein